MRVKVTEDSGLTHTSWDGEVLGWSTTFEYVANVVTQVPALILQINNRVEVISLKRDGAICNIKILEDRDDTRS